MTYLWTALKWAYSDTIPSLMFMTSLTAAIVFLMTLIAYPVQTITFIVLTSIVIILFTYFHD